MLFADDNVVVVVVFFFVQAEDGIRDLVRSRGLGDVYKRQGGGRLLRGRSHGSNSFGLARALRRRR